MVAPERDDDLLTVTELSKRLQIHPDIIHQLAGKNNPKMQLPSIRDGDRLLFSRDEV